MISRNTVIGNRYRVTRLLGGGGMKLVYLAEDLRLAARPCALAEMIDSLTDPETQRQAQAAFQREADMLAELNHQHIPAIFDRFSEQNRHYLVMEFVDGETLEQRLKANGGKLDPEATIDVALQVLDTLEYLHRRNPPIIYRDLKPSNIMTTTSGLVKLVDFGIARHFQPHSSATMIGTQGYAPPEQYRGRVDTRSDLYALGATMHQALSGRDPAGEPPFSFPPLRKLCPDVRPELADVIGAALTYDVEQRLPDTMEFRRRLLAIKNGSSAPNPVLSKPQLNLPLNKPAAPPLPPPTQQPPPTVLTASQDTACPNCSRFIPADSRFCSYCAADLRKVLGPAHVVANSEAETTRLPPPGTNGQRSRPFGRHATRRSGRNRIITLAMVAVLVYLVLRLLLYLTTALSPVGATTRPRPSYADSGSGTSPFPALPNPGASRNAWAAVQLRKMLNEEGYHSVNFAIRGDTIQLWGKVPTEADRMIVESTAFALTGALNMEDRLQVVY